MTIYDIAQKAGVSASTVSRVINGKSGVSDAVRKKVSDILEQSAYSPNLMARGLVGKASKTIGILISDLRTTHYTDGAYLIETELAKHDFCCIFINAGTDAKTQANAICTLAQRKVQGAVLIGSTFQNNAVSKAISANLYDIPVVMINGALPNKNTYGILADEESGIKECVEYLARKGRKNIALINPKVATASSMLKEKGFQAGVALAPQIENSCVFYSDNTIEGICQVTQEALAWNKHLDAIIYCSDFLAAASYPVFEKAHKKIPQDISIIGLDNSVFSQMINPTLSTIDNKLLESSTLAVHFLEDCLASRNVPHSVLLKTDFIERQST